MPWEVNTVLAAGMIEKRQLYKEREVQRKIWYYVWREHTSDNAIGKIPIDGLQKMDYYKQDAQDG